MYSFHMTCETAFFTPCTLLFIRFLVVGCMLINLNTIHFVINNSCLIFFYTTFHEYESSDFTQIFAYADVINANIEGRMLVVFNSFHVYSIYLVPFYISVERKRLDDNNF